MNRVKYILIILLLGAFFSKAQSTVTGSKIIITKLIGYEKDGRLSIEWSTDGSVETNFWEIQSSMDGEKFSTIALVLGADPGKSGKEYGFKEKINARNRGVLYRVVHVSKDAVKVQSDNIELTKFESMTLINPDINKQAPVLL